MRKAMLLAATVLFSAAAAASPQARLETNLGTIVIALEAEKAPKTVANFIRYAKEGHYNHIVVYRVVPDYVIQAGSMGADGNWRPSHKPVPLETATGLSNLRGTIAMARDDKPASAAAEWFINLSDNNAFGLDAKKDTAPNTTGFAVFGHVTAGMEVVDAIAHVPLGGGKGSFPDNYPKTPVIIKKVTIGEAPPEPAVAPATAPAPTAPAAPDQSAQTQAAPSATPQ